MMTRPTTGFEASAAPATVLASRRSWTLPQHPARPSWINDTRTRAECTLQPAMRALPINGTQSREAEFSLAALLVCDGCDRSLQPMLMADGRRGYRAPCGCRLTAADAVVVERLVRDAVERHSSALVADVPAESLGALFAALFVAVRIGGSSGDLSLVWRI
jgi:hypothetical protein